MLAYNRNHHKWFVKPLLRAIRRYGMIVPGEPVCVALSGGKDSTALLWMLAYLNRYSYLHFDLSALHVRMGDYSTAVLAGLCDGLGVQYLETRLRPQRVEMEKNACYVCARIKRGAISSLLHQRGIRRVAYGHHATDVAETFFMNIVHGGRLGSFSPRVGFDDNPMEIIRPMVYLEERTIAAIHAYHRLPLLDFRCRYAERNVRAEFKKRLTQLDGLFDVDGFALRLVSALENVDTGNLWSDVRRDGSRFVPDRKDAPR